MSEPMLRFPAHLTPFERMRLARLIGRLAAHGFAAAARERVQSPFGLHFVKSGAL